MAQPSDAIVTDQVSRMYPTLRFAMSPAIRAWAHPLLVEYSMLKGRAIRQKYKAEKLGQFKKSPLADPLAKEHDGWYFRGMTRLELLNVSH